MGVGSGEAAQLIISEESTYGIYVAVNRHFEMVSESINMKQDRIESKGLRGGQRIIKTGKWVTGKKQVGGDINLELGNIGFGVILKHMMGGIATTGSSPTYTHTATPGDLPVSLSAQVGRPDITGTVQPFTYTGGRISSWELGLKAGELAALKLTTAFQDEATATGLVAFSDPAVVPLSFVGGSVTSGGVAVDLLDFTLKGDNKLDTGRFRLRGAATAKQPLENAFREYTGNFHADFESLVQYNHYVNADELALVATFQGGLIPSGAGARYQLVVTANVRFDGETPNVSGPAVLQQPIQFKAVSTSASDSTAISLAYTTTDATP